MLFRAAAWMRARRVRARGAPGVRGGQAVGRSRRRRVRGDRLLRVLRREAMRLDAGGAVRVAARRGEHAALPGAGIGVVIAPWNFPLAIPHGHGHRGPRDGQRGASSSRPSRRRRSRPSSSRRSTPRACRRACSRSCPGCGEDVGARLVEHPDVVVRRVHRLEGGRPRHHRRRRPCTRPGQRHVKRVVAEMGGKNAVDRRRRRRPRPGGPGGRALGLRLRRARSARPRRARSSSMPSTTSSSRGSSARRASCVVGHPRDPSVVVGPGHRCRRARRASRRYVELAPARGRSCSTP